MTAIDDPTDPQPDLRDQLRAGGDAPVAHGATGAPGSRARRVKENME